MAKNWKDVKAVRPRGADSVRGVADHKDQMLREVRAQRLADLREAQGLTQASVAATMHVGQPWVSKIERGEIDTNGLRTIRQYVEALGGHLEVQATFGDHRIVIA